MADSSDMVYEPSTQTWFTKLGYKVTKATRGAGHYTAPPRGGVRVQEDGNRLDGTSSAPRATERDWSERRPAWIARNLAGALSDAADTPVLPNEQPTGHPLPVTPAATAGEAEEGAGLEGQGAKEAAPEEEVHYAEDTDGEAVIEGEEGEEERQREGQGARQAPGCAESVQVAVHEPPDVELDTAGHDPALVRRQGELAALITAMLRGALAALQSLQGHGHWHERVPDMNKRPPCTYCGMRTGWVCSCPEHPPLCGPGVQCMKSHQLGHRVPRAKQEKARYMAERERMVEEAQAAACMRPSRKRSHKQA